MWIDILSGVVLYLALTSIVLGAVSVAYPLRWLRIRTRRAAAAVLAIGILGFVVGVYLPVRETRIAVAESRLDEFAPTFQFNELHSTVVHASKERVDAAIRSVTPEDVRFYRTLIWLRGLTLPPAGRPILQSFTSGWFLPLADESGSEIVFGRCSQRGRPVPADQFRATTLEAPGIRIVMNFRIQELDSARCLLSTETRVYAVGTHMLRGFATYWRMIHPGSDLIRRMWLRAIKLRAEADAGHA